jgi:signal transduction histidine kinase/DNA-binding response OmpR family regulator
LRILLVDDESANLFVLQSLLEDLGHPIRTALSGAEALKLLAREEFALAILDIMMPEMNGVELAAKIHEQAGTRAPAVVFLTARFPDKELTAQAYATGAVDYLSKPIDSNLLVAKVKSILALAEAQRSLATETERRVRMETQLRESERQVQQKEWLLMLDSRRPEDHADRNVAFRFMTEVGAAAFEVERSSVWLFESGRCALVLADLYERTKERHSAGQKLLPDQHPTYIAALGEGRSLAAEDALTDARLRELRLGYLRAFNIQAALHAPVRWRGEIVGVLCFEHVESKRRWWPDEEAAAASLADRVALVLEAEAARAAQAALRRAHDELEERVAARTAELNVALRTAEEANTAKSRFLANVSHELRSPLNGILGLNEMMIENGLPAPQRRLAELLQHSAEGMLAIVNDLLDLAKTEAGHFEVEERVFDLIALVQETVQLHQPRAAAKELHLSTVLAPGLPAWVKGDPIRLRQVLANLIGNAVKFSTRGQVAVTGEPITAPEGRVGVCFTVRDDGPGIAPEDQQRIFEPFVQGDTSNTRAHGGTGLGLSICREIVVRMGGEIQLESTPGRGSTFRFTLTFEPAPPPAEVSLTAPHAAGSVAGLRVLIADDSDTNAIVARDRVEKLGCTAAVVRNGAEAVAACERQEFDVVLMDCHMPVMDGYEATARLRAREAAGARRIWIVALTANAMPGEDEQCRRAGMDAFLSKPFRAPQLHTALAAAARALNTLAAPAATAAPPTLDPETIAALREGDSPDSAGFRLILASFASESGTCLQAIEAARASSDAEGLRLATHKLGGSGGTIGATHLHQLCREVQLHARADRFTEAAALVPAIVEEVARVRTALDEVAAQPVKA